MSLSKQMSDLTKKSITPSSKRVIGKVKKQIKQYAKIGMVQTELKIDSTKTHTHHYLSTLVKSFLQKEGFKVKQLTGSYDRLRSGARKWHSRLEVNW